MKSKLLSALTAAVMVVEQVALGQSALTAPQIKYSDRTDSVPQKLSLLQAAYAAGNYDLAMSLAESIKDTLTFERQQSGPVPKPVVGADDYVSVEDLPSPWAKWAEGWSLAKPLALFETVGITRTGEPVEVPVAFRAEQTSDLSREVRVARIDEEGGALHEIPSQIHSVTRQGGTRYCRLVFLADVPMHGRTDYLVFCGNPNAELPRYTTDLHVTGEGYGLDIANRHYVASLSRQMGQLERLRYKREHGLELFAGGKGHGEPPTIDWAHDYVDPGQFQKLRMRNWAACPNYEVIRGPLCVRVRRWGFPHSPIHPLFTPSRMHMDQTYVFYAGQPYFLKEGSFDMVRDFAIEAMRDDEWVFSGYSFTNTVWLDAAGRLHEGPSISGDASTAIPAEHSENLWGVGFYHRDSRDAFIALRLEHTAKIFDGLKHGGAPTLNYHGHGQLWSRYPASKTSFEAGASIRQVNAYVVSPFPKQDGAATVERLRRQLLHPLEVRGEKPRVTRARAIGKLARPGETPASAPLKPAIWDALREVRDEQLYRIDSNIVDLGYVYDVAVCNGVARVVVTMPHRGRPVYDFLVTNGGGRVEEGIHERLLKLNGVRAVVVEFTWDPPWNIARLTDAGRRNLGLPE